MAEKGSPEEFHDYRRWVCSHVDSLLCGDPVFWEQFGSRRSRLRNAPDPIGARFNWERSFLERPVGKEPISRRELAAGYGVSRDRLRRYERAGMFSDALPGPEGYGLQQVKRLQWILFFTRELGIQTPGLTTLLSLEGLRSQFSHLSSSTTPDVPIHRSLPGASHPGGKRVNSRQEVPYTTVREMRDLLHEIGNKLHVISGRADRLRRKLSGNTLAEKNLTIILSQSERATKTLGDIRNLILAIPPNSPQREKWS